MIHTVCELTQAEKKQALLIMEQCHAFDGTQRQLFLSNALNFNPNMPCFFWNEEKNGFLSIFAPQQETAEISAYVIPEQRQQGIFTSLIRRAVSILQQEPIQQVLFCHEPVSLPGKKITQKWHLEIDHSEYQLEKTCHAYDDVSTCVLRAEEDDFEEISLLDQLCFNETLENSRQIVNDSLHDPNIHSYKIVEKGQIISTCYVNIGMQRKSIYGLCTAPEYRRRGYARKMLRSICSKETNTNGTNFIIEVDSTNDTAIDLYYSEGFQASLQTDYYRILLADLANIIKQS